MMMNDVETHLFYNVFKQLHKQNMEPIFYFIKNIVPDSNKSKYQQAYFKFKALSKNKLLEYQTYTIGTHDTFFTKTTSKLETFFAFIIVYYATYLLTK